MAWAQPTKEDIYAGAIRVRNCVESSAEEPFFVGRNGTIEIETLYFWITQRRGSGGRTPYPPRLRDQIQRNAGVFPATDDSIDRWCQAYLEALGVLTGTAAGWYKPLWNIENTILDEFAPETCFRMPLRSLEPYYVPADLRWTNFLAGKKVTVVSSFADTICRQVWGERMASVWRGEQEGLLSIPDVEWSFVRTGYAPVTAMGYATWPPEVDSWESAVNYVVNRVISKQPTVVLIGCGALGMIIGARLRERGISSIVLGGAIQVLFGIMGQRWATHDVISKFWNDAWVWPADHEIPGGAQMVEGGCYWRG